MIFEVVVFAFIGFLLGFVSGLTPGLHVNNFALLLAGIAPSVAEYVPTVALDGTRRSAGSSDGARRERKGGYSAFGSG
ncbi:MAG: hypothetical protein SXQ77_06855 [Halobacteria archaeon]|nr:hypothetical protein [Halobacteria archaeon]